MNTENSQPQDAPSLLNRLEREFTQVVQEDPSKDPAPGDPAMRRMAAQGREDMLIYEDGAGMKIWVLILAVLSLGGGLALLLAAALTSRAPGVGTIVFLFALGLLLLRGIYRRHRLRDSPIMTLAEQGILFGNLTQPIPWSAVDDYDVTVVAMPFPMQWILEIHTDERFALPSHKVAMRGVGHRIKVMPRKHLIRFVGLGGQMRGMTAEKFDHIIQTYWHGSLARAQLTEQGTPPSP